MLTGCEALEYQNVRELGWTIWVLVAISVVGAIVAIGRFIWKTARGQPAGKPKSAQWGTGGWRLWWWLGGTDSSASEDTGGDWSGGDGGGGD